MRAYRSSWNWEHLSTFYTLQKNPRCPGQLEKISRPSIRNIVQFKLYSMRETPLIGSSYLSNSNLMVKMLLTWGQLAWMKLKRLSIHQRLNVEHPTTINSMWKSEEITKCFSLITKWY